MTRRRIWSVVAFGVLVGVLLGASLYVRNFLFRQVEKRIRSVVEFSSLKLHLLPPSAELRDVRTVGTPFSFTAEDILVELPLASILKSEKPLVILINRPVLRVSQAAAAPGKKKAEAELTLPFSLERGVVRDGEIYFTGGVNLSVKGLQAEVRPQGTAYSLVAEASAASFWLDPTLPPLVGKLSLAVLASPRQIKVRRLSFGGKEAVFRASGDFERAPGYVGALDVSYEAEMAAVARLLGLPFDWQGSLEGKGALVLAETGPSFRSEFSSSELELNKSRLGKAAGRIETKPREGVAVDVDIQGKAGSESVRIQYVDGKVRGRFSSFHLEPIFSYLEVPYPVRSPVWGEFSFADNRFSADCEFRDKELAVSTPGQYGVQGPCHIAWDGKLDVKFDSPRLETSFATVEVKGGLVIDKSADVTIKGQISDVKTAREFTGRILTAPLVFPEIRGRGEGTITISGAWLLPQVKLDFRLAPAGFDAFDASSVDGIVYIQGDKVDGRFFLADPDLQGVISLRTDATTLGASIKMSRGELARVLPGLGVTSPFSGAASGEFQIDEKGDVLQVVGGFAAPSVKMGSETFSAVSGKLTWDGDTLGFPELSFDYGGGKIKGSGQFSTLHKVLGMDLEASDIDLHQIAPSLTGLLSLSLKGIGKLGGKVGSGQFSIKDLVIDPLQPAGARGDLDLRLSEDSVGLTVKGGFTPGSNDFQANAEIPFSGESFAVNVKGSVSNLDLLLPWKGAKGLLNYVVEVRGSPAAPQISGAIDVQGTVLPFPQFSQAVTNYSGLVVIKDNVATVRSFKGFLGGGPIQGGGEVVLIKGGPQIDLTFQGKNLQLSPFERTLANADVLLRLVKNEKRFVLEGNFDVRRLLWRREVYEKLVFYSVRYPEAQIKPGFFDDMTLDLHLRATDNAWVENSLGRMRGRFDLTVTGNVLDPIVLGTIDIISGEVKFQDRKFQVLRGRVSFFNPAVPEPYVDAQAEAYVNDYRVTITLSGLLSQLRPQFSSSPPLPPEDVLALLALGEAFRRTYRTETSTQMSSASLVSFQLTEPAQRTAEKLFSLERIRIDPFLMSSSAEMTARLTVGKSISSNFSIYYSTNLTRQTEEIIRLEWDMTSEFSLVGTRNEFGRVSVDFKIRRRF